jgi:ferredoxin-NADP reductase
MSKPVHPTFSPKLLDAKDLAADVRLFRFASPPGFGFVPGQFLMFHFEDDPKTWRAYSICSAVSDAGAFFEVAVGMVGAFSERLGLLRPGGEHGLVCRGPFGKWTWDGTGHAVLISGGTGITPFRAMALLGKGRVTVCYSSRTADNLLFRNEYDAWQKKGAAVFPRVTRPHEGSPWSGPTGRWTAAAAVAAGGSDPSAVYYLCGPKEFVSEMRAGLSAAGVPETQVRTEKWGDYSDLF